MAFIYSYKVVTPIAKGVGSTGSIVVSGSYVYAVNGTKIQAYLKSGSSLVLIDEMELLDDVGSIYVSGSRVFCSASSQGIYALNFNGTVFSVLDHSILAGTVSKINYYATSSPNLFFVVIQNSYPQINTYSYNTLTETFSSLSSLLGSSCFATNSNRYLWASDENGKLSTYELFYTGNIIKRYSSEFDLGPTDFIKGTIYLTISTGTSLSQYKSFDTEFFSYSYHRISQINSNNFNIKAFHGPFFYNYAPVPNLVAENNTDLKAYLTGTRLNGLYFITSDTSIGTIYDIDSSGGSYCIRSSTGIYLIGIVAPTNISFATPRALISASPNRGGYIDNTSIAFSNTYNTGVTSWLWDLGEGDTSVSPTPTKEFNPGRYLITLKVTDSSNNECFNYYNLDANYGYLYVYPTTSPTIYIDIEKNESDLGDGSESSPYNQMQALTFSDGTQWDGTDDAYSNVTTYRFKGQEVYPQRPPNNFTYNFTDLRTGIPNDVIISSWDLSTYGPPSWHNPIVKTTNPSFNDYFLISIYLLNENKYVLIENLAITNLELEIEVVRTFVISEVDRIDIKNCFFQAEDNMYFTFFVDSGCPISFYGCSFVGCEDDLYLLFTEVNSASIKFYDCVFIDTPEIYNDEGTPVEFHNCYFSSGTMYDDGVSYWGLIKDAVAGGVTNTSFNNCHFDYDFGTSTPPTAQTATLEQKDTFSSSLYNIPVETDPTIIERWTTEGYSTGLFGEARTGAGAWYFSASLSADFSGTPLTGNVGLRVQFSDQSTGTPTSWLWDFGDGSTSTEQNPLHLYSTIGYYTVSLTTFDGINTAEETKANYILVSQGPRDYIAGRRNPPQVKSPVGFRNL